MSGRSGEAPSLAADEEIDVGNGATTPASFSGPAGGRRVPSMGEIGLNQFDPYLINRISARWNADMTEVLREHDLTTVRMRTLAVLSVAPGLTINELSVYAVTEQSTLSRNLDAMEEAGLIERRMRENDARVREIHITGEGRDAFAAFWPDMHAAYARMFEGVPEDEHRAFTATLHRVLRNIRRHEM